ncbi:hypothetical protein TNCT_628151, partial [Trichonephila clavata]
VVLRSVTYCCPEPVVCHVTDHSPPPLNPLKMSRTAQVRYSERI